MASQLKVLDVIVNKPFTDKLNCMYEELQQSVNWPLTPVRNIIRPNETLFRQWTKTA